jgi:hypothetical protein
MPAASPYLAAGVRAFSAAPVATQRAVDRLPCACRPGPTALMPSGRSSALHGPALPDIDFLNKAISNFSPNIMSESGTTGFVEFLAKLQAEASADDFLLDLGGAAEDVRSVAQAH